MKKWLENKIIKVFFVYLLPLLIGGLFSALGNWDYTNDNLFWVKLVILFISVGIYIYTTIQYLKFEKEKNDKINELNLELNYKNNEIEMLEKEKKSLDKVTRELSTLCLDSSNSINVLSKNLLNREMTLNVWNFKKVATGICNSVYEVLCEVCKPFDDFTVNILLDDITARGKKKNVTMIAHKGKYEKYPGKFEEKMYYNKNKSFYAIKLFKSNSTDIKILTTKEEVNEKFVYIDEEHPEYAQYVGIPIVCSGNKMICLLQICAFKNDKIGNDKNEILNIIMTYIIPFTQFSLMNYKVEKSYIAGFSAIEKKEENLNDK